MTGRNTKEEIEALDESNERAKSEHAKGNKDYPLDGDGRVVASRFLIDAVLGEFKSIGVKAGGRILAIRDRSGENHTGGGSSRDLKRGAEFKDAAARLGFDRRIPPQKAPFDSHGQPVFFDGKKYITPDVDGHNVTGGWKVFDKKGRRVGTYDKDLNWVKD